MHKWTQITRERGIYIHVKIYNFLKQQILSLEFQKQQKERNLYPRLSDAVIWSECLDNESKIQIQNYSC
jgi:hypothetical protein